METWRNWTYCSLCHMRFRSFIIVFMGGLLLAFQPARGQQLPSASASASKSRSVAAWRAHWSFQKIISPPLPSARPFRDRVRNPIDSFVFARLEDESLAPSPRASKETLLRRASLDLTGLPPSLGQADEFLADSSPDAYEKLVDRLLDSPSFGERQAWDWLDAARYADSNGYQGDAERTMWPWRDWVVAAFNRNLPFDQFTLWQLAGDLLPNPTPEQLLATGFCRNYPINGEGGRIAEENRVDYVMDMAETTGTVWLGLTFNCCRCHDHKFDPLTRRDYYSLFAFFNQTPVDGSGGNPQTKPVLELPSAPKQQGAVPRVMIMADLPSPRKTYLLEKGIYDKRGDEVTAAVPASLPPLQNITRTNRLALAQWIVSPENPLTARVIVNRFWQQFFGAGLVKTPEDFGMQGDKPSHPQLLDWLAAEFVRSGWNIKHLCRLIVTSATYQQSSKLTPQLADIDPDNRLLARGPRFRMPSWMIRDEVLAASGLLVLGQEGPPVKPYQPQGVWEEATFGTKKYQPDHGASLYRRSLYIFWRRIIGPTVFFDSASRQVCTVKQLRTNTPLQALITLNDTGYAEAARAMAERVLISSPSVADRIHLAFRLALVRQPSPEECQVLSASLDRLTRQFTADPSAAKKFLANGESTPDQQLNVIEHAAYAALCSAILNLDETLTKE